MDFTFFLVKYIPFWCVPCSLIGYQFGYLYRLKGLNLIAFLFFGAAVFCSILIIYYFWTGGPVKAVEVLDNFVRDAIRYLR
ncbi:MAG: hypothetical protein VXW15_06220 [Bdellovibrionota bacterium]|nr:hypothetical protein [Bdellovibrionota bacterium]